MLLKPTQDQPLLSARFSVSYAGKAVLRNVEIDIQRGEVLGLVGQSGSGKSTLAMTILGLLDKKCTQAEGAINFHDSDLLKLSERELRGLRGRAISLVLQSPLASLKHGEPTPLGRPQTVPKQFGLLSKVFRCPLMISFSASIRRR
jgi:ABC-type microcin C transport system duplicated ATPase subunit YejF